MKIKTAQLAVIILLFIFGGVAISSALGFWKTTTDKIPASYKSGEFAGQANPADIRGSYTFGDISSTFDIPVEDLGKAFGVKDPAGYTAFKCKDLEALYSSLAAEGKEIGTGSVRYFVAMYKGLPFEASEETYLPEAAVDLLKAKVKLTAEQVSSLEKHSVKLP